MDDRGVEVVIATDAPRIVTLAPHLAELVHEAGAADQLVGVTEFTDHPAGLESLPRIGDAFRADLERLAAVRPDVVFGWLGGNPAPVLDEVERLGVPLVALRTDALDDIARHLRTIGRIAGTGDTAEAAARAYEHRLETLRERYRDAAPVRVFYQVSERPLYTFGGPHPVSDAIALCGGVNVFAGLRAPAPTVNVEAVLAAAPQVIVGGVWEAGRPDPGELAWWMRWPRIPAVRDGHVYQLDATLLGRPTPRMLDEVARLCERIDRARG